MDCTCTCTCTVYIGSVERIKLKCSNKFCSINVVLKFGEFQEVTKLAN